MGSLIQNTIWGRQKIKPFVSIWKTDNISVGSSTTTQAKLPLVNDGTYNFTVYWGDGSSNTITAYNQAAVTHTYSVAGTYTIKITGTCIGWQFNNTGDRLKLLSITSWGSLRLGDSYAYFYGCSNMNLSGITDVLDLHGTPILERCFQNCTSLTTVGKMNEWDMSSVTSLSGMFAAATNFNQPIGNWNVSNVINFSQVFTSAHSFNQDIGTWNVSSGLYFYQMFYINNSFNNGGSPSINNWQLKTTGTISMDAMFSRASSFNQPIGNWNTIAVNNMTGMFQSVTSVFNQNIGNWNVSNVLSMSNMLNGAKKFNNGGSPSIGNWDTSSCLDMSDMFRDNEFNQNIGAWNVSKVNNFYQMFAYNNFFNNGGSPSINNWQIKNTGTVSMQNMFFFSTAFNQPIGNWNISNVTNFANFMSGKTPATFSATNLDGIYNGWSKLPVKTPITITFGTAKYTAASSAGRAILTGAPNNWSITDGGI